MTIIGGAAALVFLCDGIIKYYCRSYLAFNSIPIIKNIFHITVVFNSGAAFGILRGKTAFLVYGSMMFMIFFLYAMRCEVRKNHWFAVATGLIIGGGISNFYDRVFLGYVVDYIDLRIWPVFNLSDMCITLGAIFFIFNAWRSDQNLNKKSAKCIRSGGGAKN